MLFTALFASMAHAQDEDLAPVAPVDWARRAQAAEEAADPRTALEDWRRVLAATPGSRLGGRARTRIAWLEARDEADYVPLAGLMRFLGLPPAERDAGVIENFEREISAMPPGVVRAEARVAVAGEWDRLDDSERAIAAWQAALADPDLEEGDRGLVLESLAQARMVGGDLPGAIAELDAADLGSTPLHRFASRRLRAATWLPVAASVVCLFFLVVAVLVFRSGRAVEVLASLKRAPLRIAVAILMGAGPALVVAWWGDDASAAFAAFAPCSTAIVLGAFLAGEATDARSARALVGVLAIAASLAGAYVSVVAYGEALPFA